MTTERWEQVKELFHTAMVVAETDRTRYLADHCGTDSELLEEVTALLHEIRKEDSGQPDGSSAPEPESRLPFESFLTRLAQADPAPPPHARQSEHGGAGTLDNDATIDLAGAGQARATAQPPVRCFGDYELLAEIAHGGMGVVYKARQISLNRLVALKMILAGQFASEAEVKRFQAEARAAATLDHRHIVGIFEIGCHEGQHYFTMPYIEGRSLAHPEVEGRWRAGSEAARLIAQVARAVQYAHDHGILHRDLKPANIIIDAEGDPHVSDFGLARHIGADSGLTMDGAVLGTPSFMAPEQAAGNTVKLGAAADIYGLGAILYFLLTGRPPFTAASPLDTLVQVLEGEVIVPRLINPRVGRDLERICLRCLEKLPERRYPDAGALAEDLERFVRFEPVQARPPGWRPFLVHWMRHQPALVLRLLALGICAAIAQITFHWYRPVPGTLQIGIISTLGIWGALSILCQWALGHERWINRVPFLWVILDTLCLTIALWLDDVVPDNGIPGPLVGSFPVLIVLSGLWFRTPLVGLSTLMAMLAYAMLVVGAIPSHGLVQVDWHIIFLVLLLLTGCVVAYQVHRVRALSRFYDRHL